MKREFIGRLVRLTCVICTFLSLLPGKALAQVNSFVDWQEIGEQFVLEEENEQKVWDNNFEELEDLKEHPLNLNEITKEQLEQFPFLTDLQIEHLLYYLYVNGPMETIYELQLVEDMDRQTIQYLLPFVFVGKIKDSIKYPKFRDVLKYGKNEILVRFDVPLNKKDGYRNYSDSVLNENPNKKYLGSPFYHSFKYGFRYKDLFYIGLSAEKDAGEPFFAGKNRKGYDFYSFYLFLRNVGRLKALALGNYRLSFGCGLVMSTDYNLGKSSSISTVGSKTGGIKKHSSMDEHNYFRGIAASYQLGRFVLSCYYSHRKQDAIVENGLIMSFKSDGMHRIERDFEKRNKAVNQLVGMNLNYSYQGFQLGFTAVYNFLNQVLKPEVKPYSVYAPSGKDFFNLGVDYSYRWNKFLFFGETAVDKGGRVSTLNSLRFSPLSGYQIVLLQRSYPKDYQAMFARSISENASVRNENGFYMGIEAKPLKYWKFFVYADFFRFPWLKYGVDKPSSGFDGLVQATYSPTGSVTMFGRYRYKSKDKNYRDEETKQKFVLPHLQHKFRYQLSCKLRKNFSICTTLDYVRERPEKQTASNGFMLTQAFNYSFPRVPLQLSANYGYFDTDDYASRISIYERSVLYAFSMPSFYGKGMRFAFNVRYDYNKHLAALFKFAMTNYADKDRIGDGLERINGSSKLDLYVQLRGKF